MKRLALLPFGLFALLTISACAPVQIDPPELSLYLGPPPPPRITHVVITNGAGKTVMSGRPGRSGLLNSNPGLADLDGTLTIKSTWSTGGVTTQTTTHTPNMVLTLTYDRTRSAFIVAVVPAHSVIDDAPERAGD